MFDILSEEDPGYRRIQILQDAGLIPVDHHQMSGLAAGPGNQGPARPRGISATIPQEAIDEMLKENPYEDQAQEQNQPMEDNDVIQPRNRSAAQDQQESSLTE